MSEVLELPGQTVLVRTPDGKLRPSGPACPDVATMDRRKRAYDRLVLAVIALRRDEDCIASRPISCWRIGGSTTTIESFGSISPRGG